MSPSSPLSASGSTSSLPPLTPAPSLVIPKPSVGPIKLASIEEALEAFKRGEFLVVVDDLDRENEGDLIIAADCISTEKMAWLIKHSSGYICICLPGERLQELGIGMMVESNEDKNRTAYTVTVDYKHGTTTGISAHDRALTAFKLSQEESGSRDFSRPGHMVPLRAVANGTLVRKGHTEASVDLCLLSGRRAAGIICELVKPDCPQGSMARRDDCWRFAQEWGLKMITIDQIAQYRREGGVGL